MVKVVGTHRVGVEIDAPEIDRPRQAGGVVDDGLLGRRAGGVLQLGDVDEIRALLRGALLEDGLLGDALDEALENHRPPGDTAQGAVGDGQVVADQVQLGDTRIRKDDLVRMADGHVPTVHLQR